jgi:membrane-bound serine protease (ClpP class)
VRRVLLAVAILMIPLVGFAQTDEGGIDVIDVSGPLDASALEFMRSSIVGAAERGQALAVLQVNSPAVLDEEGLSRLLTVVADPPLPVAIWVGPAPAVAYGGAAVLVASAEYAAIAPEGSMIGLVGPLVLGGVQDEAVIAVHGAAPAWLGAAVPAEESGLDLQPSIRQYLQDLDGEIFTTALGPVRAGTLRPFEDGVTLKVLTFREPGLGTRFFRLAVTPEAAFFFLVVGLTIAAFEFFAIGPGVAAGVAGLSLLLAGWGLVNLPVRPWALVVAILGWALLTAAYQKGGVFVMTVLGAVMLQVAGSFFVDGGGQLDARWYLVLPSVLAVLFFFLLAMPTVQQARFSTQTIGRDGLIGENGVALVDFDPDGLVEVRGARWRATAHREADLSAGSNVVVAGVDGMYLEVEPAEVDREN